jgi:hypothetical protein
VEWGNFIAQWVPTIIMMGVYNKLVKVAGHDQEDRGARRASQAVGISNRPISEEEAQQRHLPPRGQGVGIGTRTAGLLRIRSFRESRHHEPRRLMSK